MEKSNAANRNTPYSINYNQITTVYPCQIGLYYCPICGHELSSYTLVVQDKAQKPSKNVCKACCKCKTVFSISVKTIMNLFKNKSNTEKRVINHDFNVFYDRDKYREIRATVEPAERQITLCTKGDIRTYTIVTDKRTQIQVII
ncbi:MAG: hypothetical protein PHI27_13075 [Eubacteriales bacterium]|nr:hypothetical protein [Eubacteriales bacterium]MDD3883155.1 hypothetical protein [Eubacteriales bacterium]MDD4512462.1 hypothetical protein [Eubacteriales bacterium]